MLGDKKDGSSQMNRHRQVGRVTIELCSPLSVGTGKEGEFADNEVVRDANDLPTIPGTTLAGVLRAAALAAGFGEQRVGEIFGVEEKRRGRDLGQRSRLSVSWASIHGCDNRPVAPMIDVDDLHADPILSSLKTLVLRDHVRLGNRGVADGRGKYDHSSVLAGARFTFELDLESDNSDLASLDELVALVASRWFRLGGRTRTGLGEIKVVAYAASSFDLGELAAFQRFGQLPAALSSGCDDLCKRAVPAPPDRQGAASLELVLKPEEPWLTAGADSLCDTDNEINISPKREARLVWRGNSAKFLEDELLLPGSAIKGALRHRTAFHLRRVEKNWAGTTKKTISRAGDDVDPWCRHDGLESLFGQIHEDRRGASEVSDAGIPGRVLISDARPDGQTRPRWHVSIDRFSGAPMDGHLFVDEPVHSDEIRLSIAVAPPRGDELLPEQVWRAFNEAIGDLCEGRLNLGGGVGRGYGFFTAAAPQWQGEPEVTQ